MFIRNCWYMIAWDHELSAGALFTRTVLNEAILLYRTTHGDIVALRDRCCHRLAPLSKGRQEGDCVRCGYHGLKFDASGRCVEIPGVPNVPEKARVKAYPVALRNKWVFVWMGDAARADVALLPDNFSCDDPEWDYIPGYLHYPTRQQLICDNLLDFSHLSYVHEKTLGGSPAIAQARAEIEAVPHGIKVSRRVPNVAPPPFYRGLREFDGNIDRWLIYEFLLPGTLLMHSGGRPIGDTDMRRAVQLHSCQTVTPETDTTTHYFFQQSRRRADGDRSTTEALYRSLQLAFEEDRDMICAQSAAIAAEPDAAMLPLPMDAALLRFRRLVAQALAAEQAGVAQKPTGQAAIAM